MNLADSRTSQLAGHIGRMLLAIPLGATEQHGAHLPLDTDTAIAVELCRRLADELAEVVVAPAIAYGSSGEHAGFAGTLSIGQSALELLILELVRSADEFAGVVLVNGHGGNLSPLHSAVCTLHSEGRNVLLWCTTGPPGDSHAGHTETSAMLAIAPDRVAMPHARAGVTTPLPEIIGALREHGVRAVSESGVLGDPTTATPQAGGEILERWAWTLIAATRQHFQIAKTPKGTAT
ncbi:mycofactocin biosynthesis peptidyl-dipeptidase MftE [Nocardia sp. NPDC004860]|uniref:mycofactocin biosynthesis peptidyl-dipeptidase MftE n=1 Tax=Nocardia sp. NPDC004860 TaxID=3154557 RepID=UPI0033B94A12